MTRKALHRSILPPVERAIGRWYDSARDARAVWLLLALFVAGWTLFHVLANASIGVHPDLLEVYGWGRHLAGGYVKHPPLGGLMTAAWFALFPAADWSFYLMAMVNAAVGLYAADLIARRYLSGDKRLLVLLLLLLTPFYQIHGVRFASNQTLLSTWPLATYCFIRAFEQRNLAWSAAAGVMAAVAMLGKYFSAFLVAGFIAAALAHPDRWRYLRSTSPYISVAAGLLVLAPHIHWLATSGYQTFGYAFSSHPGGSLSELVKGEVRYIAGSLGFLALLLFVYWLIARPSRAAVAEALWPADPDRRLLAMLFWVPLALPLVVAPVLDIKLTSIWAMQAWFLLPILLLAPTSVRITRRAAIAVAGGVAAVSVALLFAAPAVAWVKHVSGTNEDRAYFPGIGAEVTRLWRETSARPLTIALGAQSLPVGFYSPDHPDTVPGFQLWTAPWVTPARLEREGWVAVCAAADRGCIAEAARLAATRPDAKRFEFEIVPRFLGKSGEPRRFIMVAAPPK